MVIFDKSTVDTWLRVSPSGVEHKTEERCSEWNELIGKIAAKRVWETLEKGWNNSDFSPLDERFSWLYFARNC